MPSPLPSNPLPRELSMPLRDMLRGVRKSVAETASLFRPLESALPEPLQSVARRVGQRLSEQPTALLAEDQLECLAGVRDLSVFDSSRAGPGEFAAVVQLALRMALDQLESSPFLVSETVAALAYRSAVARFETDKDAARRAARLARALRDHHVVGRAPGTALALGASDEQDIQLALFAVVLWLLIDRSFGDSDEADALALCVDVTASAREDIRMAFSDPDQFAAVFETYAAVV